MSRLAQRLATLSPRRRALLSLRLARLAHQSGSAAMDLHALPIRPLPAGSARPLSFAQERLWFFDRLESRLGVYNMAYALPLGATDPMVLASCLEEIVRRHDVLRAVFPAGPEGPVQEITPPGPWPLPVVDLAALPDPDRERARANSTSSTTRSSRNTGRRRRPRPSPSTSRMAAPASRRVPSSMASRRTW